MYSSAIFQAAQAEQKNPSLIDSMMTLCGGNLVYVHEKEDM